jgi:large subunit ribosomal protein L13
MEYTIDAKDKKLGRLASQIAILLMGKNKPSFEKNIVADVKVVVDNTSQMQIDNKKMAGKKYKRYSGYPGGLKEITMQKTIEKKGYSEVFRMAAYGMLPSNKLRPLMMKNLTINE